MSGGYLSLSLSVIGMHHVVSALEPDLQANIGNNATSLKMLKLETKFQAYCNERKCFDTVVDLCVHRL